MARERGEATLAKCVLHVRCPPSHVPPAIPIQNPHRRIEIPSLPACPGPRLECRECLRVANPATKPPTPAAAFGGTRPVHSRYLQHIPIYPVAPDLLVHLESPSSRGSDLSKRPPSTDAPYNRQVYDTFPEFSTGTHIPCFISHSPT